MNNLFHSVAQLFLITLVASGGVFGIRVYLRMKTQVLRGNSLDVECKYKLDEGEEVYKIKFSKGLSDMLYSYNKEENPTTRVSKRVTVKNEGSSPLTLVMDNLSHHSSGEYRCEVVVTGPYDFDSDTKTLHIIDIPPSDPEITGGAAKYKIGDLLDVNCTVGPSKPGANVEWHLNGMSWPSELFYTKDNDGAYIVTKRLQFKVEKRHIRNNNIHLSCKANIGFVWKKSVDFSAPKAD